MECNEGVMAEGNRTSMWVDKRTTERHSETWWWNDEVATAIEEKRRCYKIWHKPKQQLIGISIKRQDEMQGEVLLFRRIRQC